MTAPDTNRPTGAPPDPDPDRHPDGAAATGSRAAAPRTTKGTRTRARLLRVAAQVFADHGYHDASIVKITEAAEVGQGTFYLYFSSKQEVFEEVVRDLNSQVRHAMFEASSAESDRIAAERAGFRAFFRFAAQNPALYRIVRQAEFVAPQMLRWHYERIAEGYVDGLRAAQARGELAPIDPEVLAWALMGIGEIVGMRWALWGDADPAEPNRDGADDRPDGVPPLIFEATMRLIERALAPESTGPGDTTPVPATQEEQS
ncbi:TetR/AcrR family transcriptional regulator [Actinotalea sp. Marseille-Q4924]|uniref:TetR/AcrR family transcriptional regulator n=1 Tax=Actinotalea sp. Marseille-Q4924 TaxID=2866571 RepID=UPI001CE4676A|nr:TetR/AcrR family transcriptional regulator [Actinotalea sp. Marseille-Q4924]